MVPEDAPIRRVPARAHHSILDLGLLAGSGTSEVVVAHGYGNVTLNFDLVVVVHALRPALAAIDRKAAVLSVAVLDRLAADEVGHRLIGRGPELVIAVVLVHLRDAFDRVSPRILHGDHIFL